MRPVTPAEPARHEPAEARENRPARPWPVAPGRRPGEHQLGRGPGGRNGNGVYSLTKHGVGAFSESLRQEVTERYVRVSLVEPGATATELAGHNRPEVLQSIRSQFGQTMRAADIADAITYIVTRPRHVTVNEMLIRPTEQER